METTGEDVVKCPKCNQGNTGFDVKQRHYGDEFHGCSCGYKIQRQALIDMQEKMIDEMHSEINRLHGVIELQSLALNKLIKPDVSYYTTTGERSGTSPLPIASWGYLDINV